MLLLLVFVCCCCWHVVLLAFVFAGVLSVGPFISWRIYLPAPLYAGALFLLLAFLLCVCFSHFFGLLACLSAGLFVCWLEKIRQTIKVVDGKVDELVKLLMTMQSLTISTDAAFVLASTATSELRTSMKKVDVKVGAAQHAGDIAADEIDLLQQKGEMSLGKLDDKLKTTIQRLMNAQIGSAGAIEDKLISICTQLVAELEEIMMSCLDFSKMVR